MSQKLNTEVTINLSHPLFAYAFVWVLVIGLLSLRLTTNLLPWNLPTLMLVGGNLITIFLSYGAISLAYFAYRIRPEAERPTPGDRSLPKLRKLVRTLLILWALGSIIEVITFRGVPLTWVLAGDFSRLYIDFGIPSLHGALNGIYLFSVTAVFIDFLQTGKRRRLLLIACLLIWPVLALARSLLLAALSQMICVFLCTRGFTWKSLIKVVSWALLLVWVFGFLGDLRQFSNPFSYLVDPKYEAFFEHLPNGFLWIYVYITAPLNNIISGVTTVQPSYAPYYSIASLLPTFLRRIVLPGLNEENTSALELVDSNVNVSTIYAGFLSDFGIAGSLIAVWLLQTIAVWLFFKARTQKPSSLIAYSVAFQCLVFSPFYNLFFLQFNILQLVLCWLFNRIAGWRTQSKIPGEGHATSL